MKITKKLVTLFMAGAMSVSAFAFTACDPSGSDPSSPENPGITNPENPDNPSNPSTPTDKNAALISGVKEQKYDAVTYDMSLAQSFAGKQYAVKPDGTKGDEITENATVGEGAQKQSIKLNLADGDADIAIESPDPDGETMYQYMFLRDWNMFMAEGFDEETEENVKIDDFAGVTLMYMGKATEEIEFDITEFGEIAELADVALGMENYLVLSLGNNFGGLTLTDSTATVDLNKTIYNIAQGLNTLLDNVKATTTVGEILADKTVKGLLEPVLNSVKPELLVETVQEVLGGVPEIGQMLEALEIDLSEILVSPAEGESTYDYLVKVISSEELFTAVNKALAAMGSGSQDPAPALREGQPTLSLPNTIDKIALSFFLNLAGANLDTVKAAVKEYAKGITETSLEFQTGEVKLTEESEVIAPAAVVKASNLKVEYALGGNAVTSQSVSATVQVINSRISFNSQGPVLCVEDTTQTISLEIAYPAAKVALTDISECPTLQFAIEYETETKPLADGEGWYDYENNVEYRVVDTTVIRSKVVDKKITGFEYKKAEEPDSAYKPVGNEGEEFVIDVVIIDPENPDGEGAPSTVTFIIEAYGSNFLYMTNEQFGTLGVSFNGNNVTYSNTVAGILNGTPGAKVEA